ncbi:MAG: hypothetical protein H0T49_01820 [Chloroflexia bacterium]|jgi:hypothetical protein|nr:hypothetical protein [Chloroflexia bacterium]MDQ3044887.1 hypothetical protein [Chloroflexota bacterium]
MSEANGAAGRGEAGEPATVNDANTAPLLDSGEAATAPGLPTTIVKAAATKSPALATELLRHDAGDVEATTVTMERSGADQVSAQRLIANRSGIRTFNARSAQLDRSGVVTLNAERVVLHNSKALFVTAKEARLVRGRAGVVLANNLTTEGTARALLYIGPASGDVKPVLDFRGATVFGAVFAAVLIVLSRAFGRK